MAHPRRSPIGRVGFLIGVLLFVAACATRPGRAGRVDDSAPLADAAPESTPHFSPASAPAGSGQAHVVPQLKPGLGHGVTFDRLSVQDGLSQGTVIDILQDNVGFMWFATEDGLNRYDGYGFRVYRHDPDDPHSLGHRVVWSIYEDREGWIWVRGGIGDAVLDRYDRETDRFAHYPLYDGDDPESASSDFVWTLYEDSGGTLWAGTYRNGLHRYDREADRFVRYRHIPDDPHSLSADRVYAIQEDRGGDLWVGTLEGLNRLDRGTGRFTRYQHDPDDPQSVGNDIIQLIYQDRAGRLWLATYGVGLEQWDRETGRVIARYQHDPDDPQSIDRTDRILEIVEDRRGTLWIRHFDGRLDRFDPEAGTFVRYRHDPDDPHSLSDGVVSFVAEDRAGNLWIGTTGGLDLYDWATGRFIHYRNDPNDIRSLSSHAITSFHEDRAGVVWIGTDDRGLNLYDPWRHKFASYLVDPESTDNNVVSSIYQDRAGTLWVGTSAGLNGLDGRPDRRESAGRIFYGHDRDDPHSLSPGGVLSIYQDREGTLWVGTESGLNELDRATGRFAHYQQAAPGEYTLGIGAVFSILQDHSGTLWLGRHRRGLCRFDRETGDCTDYMYSPDDALSPRNMVKQVYEDRQGTLWVGTEGGLLQFDPASGAYTVYAHDVEDPHSLSNDEIRCIAEDSSGVLWVTTHGGGLNRFDRGTETFTHYTQQDGLPSNVVLSLLEDDQGTFWLGTSNGLSRFDPRTESFRNYDADDGLQGSEFLLGAYHKSSGKELFFGGINGFNAFYPQDVQDSTYVPPVVLTSLTQGGENVPSARTVESLEQVTFHWPNNFFEFEFTALSYSRPHKNHYAYRLEGFDQDWNDIGTRRLGKYTNLPGGTYTLRLAGTNSDGVWNERGASIEIAVVPPFWATWWFRGMIALLTIAAVAGGLRLRIRNIEAQSRELEREVAARTRELAALNAVAAVVSHSLDLEQILSDALEKTLEVMGTEAGGIYVLDEREGVLNVAAHRGLSPEFVSAIDGLAVGEGLSGRVVESGEPLIVPDVSADARLTRMAVREQGLHSLVIAPLHSKGKMRGTLFAVTRGYREFGEGDVQLLTSIAQQIGVALDNARFVESEQRRAEQFRVIGQVGHHITSILGVEPLLQEIAQSLHEAFGYNVVGIGLVEGNELVVKAAIGAHWQDPNQPPLRIKVGQEGVMGWVASTGQPLLVPDVRAEPRYLLWPDDAETRSELAVPLQSKSGVIGVLNVESDQLNAFDDSDLMVLRSLADQATVAIETARLFEAEQRRAEQFRVIAEVGRRVTLTPDVDRVLEQVVRLVQQAFGYYHVGIGMVEKDEVVYRVGAGELWDEPEFEFRPARLKVGREGLTGWVAGSGEPLLVPDVSLEPRYVWMQGSKTRSELLVPIAVKGEVVGVLDVQSDRLNDFDETDLAVLQSLAHQVGAAIENAQLYEQAQQAAVVQERNRLARELHDAVTQTLFSASLIAEAVPDSWDNDPEEGRQLLEELRQLSRGALAEMRTLLLELRPAALVETDLCDLMRQLAEAATGREGIPVTVEVEGRCRLPTEVHVALYRIAQEALNNVVKHAHASRATVTLRAAPARPIPMGPAGLPAGHGGHVELSIRDDGRGFDLKRTPPDRLGLGIMRERAQAIGATLTVDSRPGQGTEVRVVWTEPD